MTDTPESLEALADGLCSLSGVIIDTVMDGEERPFGLRLSPVEATGLSSEAAAALRRYAALLVAARAEAAVVAAARAAALQEAAEAVSRATYTIPAQPGLTPAEAEERAVWMVSDQAADIIAALAALPTPTP